jgi:glutamate 5-kinase
LKVNKILVVKIGSRLIAERFESDLLFTANHIEQLIGMGYKIVLISSGAVELGRQLFNQQFNDTPIRTPKYRSLLASIGQGEVIARCGKLLKCNSGQVLVDREDFSDRKQFLATSRIIFQMLSHNVIPIINENDTLNCGQRSLGNNDILAAHVASMLGASWLILLTDTPYLYKDFPICKEPIYRCSANDMSLMKYCGSSSSSIGTGGMISKVTAAQLAAKKGVNTLIGSGSVNILDAIQPSSTLATQLMAEASSSIHGFRVWLSDVSESKGSVFIDLGAEQAIVSKGASLLLPGIVKFDGIFNVRDVVTIKSMLSGKALAKGIIRMSSNQLNEKLINPYSSVDGANRESIVIHRNELVVSKVSTENLVMNTQYLTEE